MVWRILLIVFTVVTLLVGGASTVVAQAPPDPQVQRLIDEGTEAFKDNRFREALGSFEEAYRRGRLGQLQYLIGRCHEELGQLGEAAKAYSAFLESDAPATAKAKAESALRLIERRLQTGRLVLQVAPFGAEVWVDGKLAGKAPLEPLAVKPGYHAVRVNAPGYEESQTTAEVPAGGEHTVVVSLVERPVERPTEREGPTAVAQPTEAPGPDLTPWAWSTLGVGVALAIGGTTSYALGEKDHKDLVATPGYGSGGVADRTRQDALDLEASGSTKKTVGYVLWGVGGAAIATSVVLFVLDEGGDEPAVSAGATPAPGGAMFSLGGRF